MLYFQSSKIKLESARRLENISKNGLRKSFSLNSLDKLYKNDHNENEPENCVDDQENIPETDDETIDGEQLIESAEKPADLVNDAETKIDHESTEATAENQKSDDQKSFDGSIKSFELELGEDLLVKDDSKAENGSEQETEVPGQEPETEQEQVSENTLNLDDSLEDGEIVEDDVETEIENGVRQDVPRETDKAVESNSDEKSRDMAKETDEMASATPVPSVAAMMASLEKANVDPKIEPKKSNRKVKKFETKWPKIEKVERRKSLDCLELLAKEMISNDFLKTARAIIKMKKEEPDCPVKKEEFQNRNQEYKIEISKKEPVQTSPKSSKPLQSSPGIHAPESF